MSSALQLNLLVDPHFNHEQIAHGIDPQAPAIPRRSASAPPAPGRPATASAPKKNEWVSRNLRGWGVEKKRSWSKQELFGPSHVGDISKSDASRPRFQCAALVLGLLKSQLRDFTRCRGRPIRRRRGLYQKGLPPANLCLRENRSHTVFTSAIVNI